MNETGKKGQSGTEIILVLGIAIIILINIIGIYNQMTSSSSCQGAAATARAATDAIADMAEIVHTQAVGSRSSLFINLPHDVSYIAIGNKTIRMGVACGTSNREVARAFAFNVTGFLDVMGGTQHVHVESYQPYVLITGTPSNLTLGQRLCGNGYRELGEKCDLRSTNNKTCVEMGYRGGVLQCTADCGWDLSTCEADNPPLITLGSPADNLSIENATGVTLDCTATDDFALTRLGIWTNTSGSWTSAINCSASGTTANCSINLTVPYGWTQWGCFAIDDINQSTWSEKRAFFLTNSTPIIMLMTPIDGWSIYNVRGVEITTLLTMNEITPQWQAEALISSMVNWLLSTSGECECGTDIGACRQNVQQCVGGSWGLCEGTPPINEVCNGVDDDCNDLVDEDILCACTNNTVEVCGNGIGICSLGNRTCNGGIWSECLGDTPPEEEVCDGLDNDCDGVVDDIPPQECGVSSRGECAMGLQYCTDGDWGGCDGAVMPSAEVCDNLDNDCDGLVDEINCVCTTGSTRACPTLCGSGLQTCEDGFWGACSELTGPQPETCNGIDDNCDGRIDDGLSRACGCDCADNRILVVLDRNHHGEDILDVNYTLGILSRQKINYTFMDEPSSGLLLNNTAGYKLVWFINPGWPPDTRTTLQTLITLNQQGIPLVLHGDDMTWGMTELTATDLEPLTGLRHVNNGLDTNYNVTFADKDHPVLTYLRARNFLYQNDDIDTSVIIDTVSTTPLAHGYALSNPSYSGPAITVRDTIDKINITFTCRASSPYKVVRIEIWTNLTGTFQAVGSCETNSSYANCSMDIPIGFGTMVWNCYATDSRGAIGFSPRNFTIHRVSEDINTYGLIVAEHNSGSRVITINPLNGSRKWYGNTTNNPDSLGSGDGNGDGLTETYFARTNASGLGALAANGSRLWNRTISGDTVKTPRLIVQNGFVYWASAQGKIYKTNGTTGVDAWSSTGPFPGSDGGLRVITLGDVDHDAHPDIFAADWLANKGYARAYNGNTGSLRWSVNVGNTRLFSANKLLAMDANGDGYSDVIYGSTNGRVYALNGLTGSTLWTSSYALGTRVTHIALGNFTADSRTDVVVMGRQQSAIYAFNGQTGALVWRHVVANGNANILETADLDLDGYSDVIYGNITANTITTINGRTNTTMWSAPTVAGPELTMTTWDVNKDGHPDIIASQANGALRAINGRNGTVIWTNTDSVNIDGHISVGTIK